MKIIVDNIQPLNPDTLMDNFKKLYPNCRLSNIYKSKQDNRFRIVIYENNKKFTKTMSFPKLLVEVHINRRLTDDETVDHKDNDATNNDVKNLRVMLRKDHCANDAIRLKSQDFTCEVCGTKFTLSSKKLLDAIFNRKKGKAGPFCSKSCAGKASHSIKSFKTHEVIRERYTLKEIELNQ